MGRLTPDLYKQVSNNLAEMNALYENHDSLICIPLSERVMQKARIIGKQIDIELAVNTPKVIIL